MSQKMIIQEIDRTMETIAEQWEIIRKYKSKIPFIEMDIFIDNLRKLYEELIMLEKQNKEKVAEYASPVLPEPNVPPAPVSPAIQPASDIAVAETSPLKPAENNNTAEEIIPNPPEVVPSTSEIEIEIVEADPVEPIVATPPARKSITLPVPDLFGSHTHTLAEKFQAEKKTVKDQLSELGNDNSLGNKMQQSQIPDLKSAIGINDKFLFINELFKGDLAGYNRTIESLNVCASRQDAHNKLDQLSRQFHWPENSSSLKRLYDFLKRRYPD